MRMCANSRAGGRFNAACALLASNNNLKPNENGNTNYADRISDMPYDIRMDCIQTS
jgi:hypothetical protein